MLPADGFFKLVLDIFYSLKALQANRIGNIPVRVITGLYPIARQCLRSLQRYR